MPDIALGPLMVDVPGTALGPDDISLLKHPAVGGVILFSRNCESPGQLAGLVAEIRSLRTPSPIIAVDQEGGRVQRFREGFYALPSALRIGEAYRADPQRGLELARCLGEMMAGELVACGIDLSFAPVLDCHNPDSQVIGDRSFSHDPGTVATLAGSFIRGMNAAGMAATGKHFPGHGGVREDSHTCLPVDGRGLPELQARDLVPFASLANRLGGIMTAHVKFDAVDSALPAFSRYWLETILRRRLGFEGVIFSDDLTMQGAETAGNIPDRARKALDSGCDMALICNDREAALQAASGLDPSALKPGRIGPMRAHKTKNAVDLAVLRSRLDRLLT